MKLRYMLLIISILFLGFLSSPVRADGDVSVCDEANLLAALSGGGLVTFSCSGTITLSSPISITENTVIDASGQNVTISGDDSFNVVNVGDATVTLRNLTVADGYGGSYTAGGAIDNSGNLTLDHVRVTGSSAGTGGAIANYDTLTIINSTIAYNGAFGNLGGLAGAIYHGGGSLTIDRSTFVSNHSNVAGAIYVLGGNVNIANSTFYYNTADPSDGGAIYNSENGAVTITNSTFSENSAGQYSDGSAIFNDGGSVVMQNTIVAYSQNGDNCAGTITDGGGNLSYPDSTCPGINLDPVLGPLQDNGGATRTTALLDGSSAIDNGLDSICNSAPVNGVDQRGVARPIGDHCDIGAYETEAMSPDQNFVMNIDPSGTAMCLSESASFNVELLSVEGFDIPVDLSVSGLPEGTTASFDTNPLTPTASTQLTISDTGTASTGAYTIDVVGTAVTRTHFISAYLYVYDTVPNVQPTLLSPADGITNTLWTPIFAWERLPGAIYYGLQVATDIQFTNIVYSNTVIGTTDTPYPSLPQGTQLYWRLKAWNQCGEGPYSEPFTFTTTGSTFPPTFTIEPDPDTIWACPGDNMQSDLTLIALGGFSGAVTLSTNGLPDGATASFAQNPVTPNALTQLTISSPDPESAGYHAVEIIGASDTLTKSEYLFLNLKLPTPEVAPNLLTPTNGMTDTVLMPTLTWEAVSGVSGVTAGYKLEVATDSGFNNIVYATIVGQTSRTLPTPLAENTQYFWRVKAWTQCGEGPYSDAFTFTTMGSTSTPTFTMHANPSSTWACIPDEAQLDITLTGVGGFDSPVTLSTNELDEGMTADFDVNPIVPNATTQLTVSSLDPDNAGNHTIEITGTSDTITNSMSVFVLLKVPAPDVAPLLLSPTDGMTDTELMPTLTWEAVSNASSYALELAADSSFTNVVHSTTVSQTNHTLPVSLDENTPYFWRVTPENDCGVGPVSPMFTFTTMGDNTPPMSQEHIYIPLIMSNE